MTSLPSANYPNRAGAVIVEAQRSVLPVKSESAPDRPADAALKELGERLLAEWAQSSNEHLDNGPSLLIFNRAAPGLELETLGKRGGTVSLRLASSERGALEWQEAAVAHACSHALPLQTASFSIVVLCHVVASGGEPELAEACRLLHPAGRLFVLGLNRAGLRYWKTRASANLPGMRPLAVRARLEDLDMNVLGLCGTGFLQSRRPRQMNKGLARLLLPVADLLMIVAKRVEPRIMNPLTKSRLRAVGAPSALAGQ